MWRADAQIVFVTVMLPLTFQAPLHGLRTVASVARRSLGRSQLLGVRRTGDAK